MTRSRKVLLGVICIVVLVGVSWIIAANVVGNDGIKETSSSKQVSQGVIDALTVKTSTYTGVTNDGVVKFDVDALKGAPPRLWNDALALRFQSTTDPAAMSDELKNQIWVDPEVGVTYAHFFADLKVGQVVIGDLNPWLSPYKGNPDQINDQAKYFIPLIDVVNPSKAQQDDAVVKNREYQQFAGLVNTLVDRFTREGVEDKRKSVLSYHLAGSGITAGQLPEVEIDPESEDKPALIFSVYDKAQGHSCAKLQWGANLGDKRPELFDVKCEGTPGQPGTPGTTTPVNPSGGGTPGCTHDCNPTSTPPKGCTHDCNPTSTPPKGCTHDCNPTTPPAPKDRRQDPVEQGNTNNGGRNTDPGPGTLEPRPADPPSTPRTNQPVPTADPVPTGATPTATQSAPAPEPGAGTGSSGGGHVGSDPGGF